jgi:L-ascorbate metabolism protein UlaG (beta-lactamase superfamily)
VSALRPFLRAGPASTAEPGQGAHQLTFLGTAGFVVEGGGRTLVLDPFVTRPDLLTTLFGRLVPDEAAIARHVPHADEVLLGHAHHDHALDGPIVCRQTGARLVGSESALNLGRAAGLPESQLVRADGPLRCGNVTVTPLLSRHGKALFGRVPLPGDIPRPPPWPPRLRDLRHGPVYNWLLDLGGTRVLHVDSADYVDEALEPVDILCLCAVGRQYRRDYTRGIVARTRPKVVIPCHWDDFTLPFDAPPRQLPGVDVEGFVDEIHAAGSRAVVLGLGQRWRF